MGPLVFDKRVKFHDPRLNRSREISPDAVRLYIRLFFPYNFQREVDNDVISGVAVDNVCMDVPIKFGDSSSNGFRDIRGADIVSNERTYIGEAYCNSAKRDHISPKMQKIKINKKHVHLNK